MVNSSGSICLDDNNEADQSNRGVSGSELLIKHVLNAGITFNVFVGFSMFTYILYVLLRDAGWPAYTPPFGLFGLALLLVAPFSLLHITLHTKNTRIQLLNYLPTLSQPDEYDIGTYWGSVYTMIFVTIAFGRHLIEPPTAGWPFEAVSVGVSLLVTTLVVAPSVSLFIAHSLGVVAARSDED